MRREKPRGALRFAGLLLVLAVTAFGGYQALFHPETPLPPEWNPAEPLDVSEPFTPLTDWKMTRALASRASCLAALETGAAFTPMADLEESEACHIRNRVNLREAGAAALKPVETTCDTALRLAMWLRHGVQPAAERHLGGAVQNVRHYSSYNCRRMRLASGESGRMSSHATASSIDVSGFVGPSGALIDLRRDWGGDDAEARFLRDVNDAACMWFRVTLGPRYNALHADHFHLQGPGWGLCR